MIRPHEVPQTDMHCVPADSIQKRPKNLLRLEAESLMLRNQGGMVSLCNFNSRIM